MAAKKSNKTEHVLKLITKNDDAARDDLFDIGQEIADNSSLAGMKEISVEVRQEPIAAAAPEPPVELKQEPPVQFKQDPPVELKLDPPVELKLDPPVELPKEPPTLRAFREQESAGNIGSAILEQSDDLVNIAEVLAKEKLSLVMERMKVCSCKTCTNDVLALALNSLPTKYVTTDAGKQYFQLDVYKKQYETDILAALTKACVRVKASPRH